MRIAAIVIASHVLLAVFLASVTWCMGGAMNGTAYGALAFLGVVTSCSSMGIDWILRRLGWLPDADPWWGGR